MMYPVPFLRYDTEAEVLALEQQVSSTLAETYSFPLELASVPGSPKVIRLEPVFERGLLLTLVSYVTTQNLDQASIDGEVPQVHAALSEVLPDLCHQKGRIAYKAFAQPPVDATRSYPFINAVAICP